MCPPGCALWVCHPASAPAAGIANLCCRGDSQMLPRRRAIERMLTNSLSLLSRYFSWPFACILVRMPARSLPALVMLRSPLWFLLPVGLLYGALALLPIGVILRQGLTDGGAPLLT